MIDIVEFDAISPGDIIVTEGFSDSEIHIQTVEKVDAEDGSFISRETGLNIYPPDTKQIVRIGSDKALPVVYINRRIMRLRYISVGKENENETR